MWFICSLMDYICTHNKSNTNIQLVSITSYCCAEIINLYLPLTLTNRTRMIAGWSKLLLQAMLEVVLLEEITAIHPEQKYHESTKGNDLLDIYTTRCTVCVVGQSTTQLDLLSSCNQIFYPPSVIISDIQHHATYHSTPTSNRPLFPILFSFISFINSFPWEILVHYVTVQTKTGIVSDVVMTSEKLNKFVSGKTHVRYSVVLYNIQSKTTPATS